jgi:hypothetical protein
MAIDRERGAFVQEEYRYETAQDDSVKAIQKQARIIEIDTNLNMAAAAAFAAEILADQKHVCQAFRLRFQGIDVVKPSDFIGSPPTFLCNFPEWPTDLTSKLRLLEVEADPESWTTTVLIKGAIK